MNPIQQAFQYLSAHRGVAITLLFSAYVLLYDEIAYLFFDYFLHDPVARATTDVIALHETNYALGAAICVSTALEFYGLHRRIGPGDRKSGLVPVWIFHLIVSAVLTLVAVQSFGFDLDRNPGRTVMSAAIVAVIIKEIAVLCMTFRTEKKALTRTGEIAADLCLLAHYCVGFTAAWSGLVLAGGPAMSLLRWAHDPGMLVVNTFAMFLLFSVFFLPFKIAYISGSGPRALKDRVIDYASAALSVVFILLPLFEGHTSIGAAMKEPSKVRALFLGSNGLRALPPEIGSFANLRVLDISNNRLESLPAEIAAAKNLRWIDAGKNAFAEVPGPLLSLERLEYLNLGGNLIGSLPAGMGRLVDLKTLNASGNRVVSIAPELASCARMRDLNLEHNHIPSLPEGIYRMTRLRTLKLGWNCIRQVPPGFETMTFLDEVDLRYNAFSGEEIERIKKMFPEKPANGPGKKTRLKV